MALSEEAKSLRALFNRLRCYTIKDWAANSNTPFPSAAEEATVSRADVVSSRYNDGTARHVLVIDIDHPAWLVKSSTPGHFHLYVDVPDGIPHELYMALLGTLADCGLIEQGYSTASHKRGFSCVRLPWIKKPQAQRPSGVTYPPRGVTFPLPPRLPDWADEEARI